MKIAVIPHFIYPLHKSTTHALITDDRKTLLLISPSGMASLVLEWCLGLAPSAAEPNDGAGVAPLVLVVIPVHTWRSGSVVDD
jgi:hypothetical protein